MRRVYRLRLRGDLLNGDRRLDPDSKWRGMVLVFALTVVKRFEDVRDADVRDADGETDFWSGMCIVVNLYRSNSNDR